VSGSTSVDDPPAGPGDDELTMGIDPWERNWMKISIALLLGFAVAVTVAGFAAGFQLPGEDSKVDPREVLDQPPWSEPGVFEVGPGQFEAYVIAQTWSFAPREIVVPVGAEVDIFVTSPDLQHGFKITDTNVNMQVVPGQVSKLTFTFDEVGEFPYICHEYCGSGHAAMFGTVRVLSETDYEAEITGAAEATETDTADADTSDTDTADADTSDS
jgi:cytochrome c oxidase subunit 2